MLSASALPSEYPQQHSDQSFQYLCLFCRRITLLITDFSSVIDIWSLQPQPHLQPQATLPAPISASNSPTPSRENAVITVSTTDKATSRPTSGNTAPKHWGEVVVNTNKKRSRQDLKDDGIVTRDVFGVLKVT
jgi:hypothetical protein